jgi:uncharacterized membrane protein
MENQKKWFKSRTIWISIVGVIIKFATPFLGEYNIHIPEGLVELILGGAVVQGRVSNTPIKTKK